ncbi:MAG: hypothetical protein ACRYHA_09070, partial [Janthinobacterium lividum]
MTAIDRRDFLGAAGALLSSACLPSLALAQTPAGPKAGPAGATGKPRRGGTLNMLINPEPPVLVSIFQTTG